MKKILFIGESWMFQKTEYKGFDSFTVSGYEVATQWMQQAIEKAGFEFVHIPAHEVETKFPVTLEELQKYDIVMVSDVGYNTFALSTKTFHQCQVDVNRLDLIESYVREGGSFVMIGGYLSFQGFEGKGKYKGSQIEKLLPVTMMEGDDRVEMPQGYAIQIDPDSHPVLKGIPKEWPLILGYNKLQAKEDAIILAKKDEDPLLVLGTYGKGRSMAYATDCSPHWASPAFCDWEYYDCLWKNIIEWLCERS